MRSSRGFTIIELIVVLAVMVIAVAFGVAEFKTDHYRLRSASFNLKSGLMRARSEAIKRNESVQVIFTTKGYSAQTKSGEEIPQIKCDMNSKEVPPSSLYGITVDNTHYPGSKVTFSPRGTATNGYVRLSNSDGNKTIRTNSAGKIWID